MRAALSTLRPGPRPRLRVLPAVVFGIVIAAHLALIAQSVFNQRLWEDEALNLTVPLNLLAGLGYTSDGTLSGSVLTPFDVRISTGPTVLLPVTLLIGLGLDPVIGGRLVAAAFWLLLVAGLALVGRRISGAWGAIVASAIPLTLHTNQGFSPIQGPADVLGEPAAAALIVWAMLTVQRRPLVAALLVGLAIQAKFIALLALPALAIGLLVARRVTPRRWIRELWKPALVAAAPTALYELSALAFLGVRDFLVHAKQFVYFLLSSGQTVEPTSVGARAQYLMSSWFVPAPLAWAVLVVAAALIVGALAHVAGVWNDERRRMLITVAVATLVGLATCLMWWLTASHTPLWVRHPAPALLSFVPVLGAFAVLGLQNLARSDRRRSVSQRAARVATRAVVAVFLGVVMLAQLGLHLGDAFAPRGETLATQRDEAAHIADHVGELDQRDGTRWLAADPWGSAVSMILLSGFHIGLADAPEMSEVPRVAEGECPRGDTLVSTGRYALCSP